MKKRAHNRCWIASLVLASVALAAPAAAQNINVRITADNAYRFGFGPVNGFTPASPNIENPNASDIFTCADGPEAHSVTANPNEYLYIVAYADKETTQGVLGQFQFGANPPIYTGMGAWQVCATGNDFDPGSASGSPTPALIAADIIQCNTGNPATTSQAWVDTNGTAIGKLQFGELNVGPGKIDFSPVCTTGANGIDPAARWMWYNWDPANLNWPAQSPFAWPGTSTTNIDDEYLIFRLPMGEVPGVECPKLEVRHQYAAKFVCYRWTEQPLALVRGYYGTAINVHEPRLTPGPKERVRPTRLAKKVAVALPGEKVGPVSPYRLESLGPDQAFEIDCDDIRKLAGTLLPGPFTGFVVIDSDLPLDVTAVYTARAVQGEVSTMDVEVVPERRMEGTLTICP